MSDVTAIELVRPAPNAFGVSAVIEQAGGAGVAVSDFLLTFQNGEKDFGILIPLPANIPPIKLPLGEPVVDGRSLVFKTTSNADETICRLHSVPAEALAEWSITLDNWLTGVSIVARLKFDGAITAEGKTIQLALELDFQADAVFPNINHQTTLIDLAPITSPNEVIFEPDIRPGNDSLKFSLEDNLSFPILFIRSGTAPLDLGISRLTLDLLRKGADSNWSVAVGMSGQIGAEKQPVIHLGSSLARLENRGPVTFFAHSVQGLALTFPAGIIKLVVDLFAPYPNSPALVSSVWTAPGAATPDTAFIYLELTLQPVDPPVPDLIWNKRLTLTESFHNRLQTSLATTLVNVTSRRLQSLAGSVFGTTTSTAVTFAPCETHKPTLVPTEGGSALALEVCLKVTLKAAEPEPLLVAEGFFTFVIGKRSADGGFAVKPGAFQCKGGTLTVVEKGGFHSKFASDLISLHIPEKAAFTFACDPDDPHIAWKPLASDGAAPSALIEMRIPASDKADDAEEHRPAGFTFELQRFRLHGGGIDLFGAVRSEVVTLDSRMDPVLVKAVNTGDKGSNSNTQRPDPKIGEIEFRNSVLIYGSLQASARLPYFDDAIGTLTLLLAQDPASKTLSCAGTMDISGLNEFHVDALYLTCQIDHFTLNTRYSDRRWQSSAAMTGRLKFAPPRGRAASEMGILSDLFKGVTLEFEDLNPLDLGAGKQITLHTPPSQFAIAEILQVELRGIVIEVGQLGLLGDVKMQRLPGIDSDLTFGGITLHKSNGGIPSFDINAIGAQFSVAGGFTMTGKLVEIKSGEVGFGGQFSIQTEVLPQLDGLVKLTRIQALDGSWVPSLALYLETDVDIQLVLGFFLRRLGVGVGLRQALRGLEPTSKKKKLHEKIIALVESPAGLPLPDKLESWVPVRPAKASSRMDWMVVAAGLITLGKEAKDVVHPLAGNLLLAIDQQLTIVAGANIWLFASPNDTQQADFRRRPAGRGAIGISTREQRIFAHFRTLKNPKLNDKAPALLAAVLGKVQTTLTFAADRKGFLVEVGWPWETRIAHKIGPFSGELRSGYRYGIYRGVTTFQLNYGLLIKLRSDHRLGFHAMGIGAEARVIVEGEGYFRASFAGALTRSFKPYLLGDVRINATFKIRVEASFSIRIKITRWLKITRHFSFSESLELALTASLTAAMDAKPDLGFSGNATVSLAVCGYRIQGEIGFAYNAELIDKVRRQLDHLLPANPLVTPIPGKGNTISIPDQQTQKWHYRFCRLTRSDGKDVVRVLLFPAPGTPYPAPPKLPSDPPAPDPIPRFKLRLKSSDAFLGFVGSQKEKELDNFNLTWDENFDHVIFSKKDQEAEARRALHEFESGRGPDPADPKQEDDQDQQQPQDITVRKFLNNLDESSLTHFNGAELSDHRTQSAIAPSADDSTAALTLDNARSPYLRLNGTYDQAIAAATTSPIPKPEDKATTGAKKDPKRIAPGLLLTELLRLLKDASAQGGQAIANASSYVVAPQMRLVLEFSDSDNRDPDPVPHLIDLKDLQQDLAEDPVLHLIDPKDLQKALTEQFEKSRVVLGGKPTMLESAAGPSGRTQEYDLIAGPAYQSPTEICLTWEFLREHSNGPMSAPATVDGDLNPFDAYVELETFVVTRTTLVGAKANNEPLKVKTLPAWVEKKEGTQTTFIRPQFQYVDHQLNDIVEGDLVQYRVEAEATDRILASCVITLIRHALKPLLPVSQAMLLHSITPLASDRIDLWVTADNDPEATEHMVTASKLRLRHRRVPASMVGAYGFTSHPPVKVHWEDGLQGSAADIAPPEIKFATSGHADSIPWRETEDDTLLLLAKKRQFKAVQVGSAVLPALFHLSFALNDIPGLQNLAGDAVEFFVGWEVEGKAGKVQARAALLKCHHALLFTTEAQGADPTSDPILLPTGYLDLSVGNPVAAIEQIQATAQQYLDPFHLQATVRGYDDGVGKIALHLRWYHDLSHRSGNDFNPVVGYRLFRRDRYDPSVADFGGQPPLERAEVHVTVVPDLLYRATSPTIELRGLQAVDGVSPLADNLIPDGKLSFTLLDLTPEPLVWEGEPALLSKGLYDYLEELTEALDARCIIRMSNPLVDKVYVIQEELIEEPLDGSTALPVMTIKEQIEAALALFKTRLQSFTQMLTVNSDPFGWKGTEALGFSCECYFVASNQVPLHAETVRTFMASQPPPPAIAAAFFRADDGKTLLNVMRVTDAIGLISTPINGNGEAKDQQLRQLLWLTLMGRDPVISNGTDIFDHIHPLEEASSALTTTVTELRERFQPFASGTEFFNAEGTVEDVSGQGRQAHATVSLPISRDGLIEYQLPVADKWAHEYEIGVALVRRYDAVRDALKAITADAPTPSTPLPEMRVRQVQVQRSEALAPPNLVATPLPGSIQAIIVRHPAAFAATASAINAAYGQYSGQSVRLERRIADLATLQALYQRLNTEVEPAPLDWQRYLKWVAAQEEAALEKATPTPPLVPGSESAIYGADRYLFPDLPAYYEYRVSTYSTAGRVTSAVDSSPWLKPLYDRDRQCPTPTLYSNEHFTVSEAPYDTTTAGLSLRLGLIPPRFHLSPPLRKRWHEAETLVQVFTSIGRTPGIAVTLGSLPDLYLTYQLYVRVDEDESTPIYVPLCRIVGPQAAENTGEAGARWFQLIVPDGNFDKNTFRLRQDGSGELQLVLELTITDPLMQARFAAVGDDEDKRRALVGVTVSRNGVNSKIQPKPPITERGVE
jgi:hypothetical protein